MKRSLVSNKVPQGSCGKLLRRVSIGTASIKLFVAALALVALGTGCTVKMGGAPPSNYDYSEYERYERPHAVSPTYAEQGYVPAASADAED